LPIPNRYVQDLSSSLPSGADGELILGKANDDPYRRTVSAVMSDDSSSGLTVNFHVFDNYLSPWGFDARFAHVVATLSNVRYVSVVPHIVIANAEELDEYFQKTVDDGYEGVMLRKMDGLYKFGRSTEKQGDLLKLKSFLDSEAEILDVYEQMHNENEPVTNAIGRTQRSTVAAGMVPAGILGGFEVKDLKTGVSFKVGNGFELKERVDLWAAPTIGLLGKIIKYSYFPTGSKEKPRFPVFRGFRDKRDMS